MRNEEGEREKDDATLHSQGHQADRRARPAVAAVQASAPHGSRGHAMGGRGQDIIANTRFEAPLHSSSGRVQQGTPLHARLVRLYH